ncbi:hypothetical protein JKF63_01493 [Porcisia hertigi]|uniref:Uncharacterized protein n=1 Tax=Porcisia hertigi TaxID=2761500 RepID=A0A836IEJ0_9TRYP|nr:hypothetical protein JKF63_01493 [Porcisia hertigi]
MTAGIKTFKNIGLPIIGFGIGWTAFTALEQSGFLSESMQRWLHVHNLKLQLYTQRLLPNAVVHKYCYPGDTLQAMINFLEKGYSEAEMSDRMTFDEVLRQCAVPEQIAYLEEHALEDIPYFYIADIFHSWANLNVHSFVRQQQLSQKDTATSAASPTSPAVSAAPSAALVLRSDAAFDSEVLCSSLWEKMISNVIPFDVSIRALCVLAVNNRANAQRLAKLSSPQRVVELYNEYMDKCHADEQQGSDPVVVSPDEVAAATLFFFRAVNDASIHKTWIPLLGALQKDPYPLARKVQSGSWCRAFGSLTPAVRGATSETALVLADVMKERLRCCELRGDATALSHPSSS